MEVKNRIKLMLGITDDDELLNEIIALTESKILFEIKEASIPKELDFVLIELCVTRYNRIGSEGLKSESVDGRVQSYEDDIAKYRDIFNEYLYNKEKNKPRVRFL